MARRNVSRNFPLEWKTDTIQQDVGETVTTGEFDLDLLPDEIAEIVGISSWITMALTTAVIDTVVASMYLSMDPDADDSPDTVVAKRIPALEDLEVFYHHRFDIQADYSEAAETGGYAIKTSDNDKMWLPEHSPILVGTNFSQVTTGDATQLVNYITTVYFKRKRATASQLNQILLKRR